MRWIWRIHDRLLIITVLVRNTIDSKQLAFSGPLILAPEHFLATTYPEHSVAIAPLFRRFEADVYFNFTFLLKSVGGEEVSMSRSCQNGRKPKPG